MIQRASARWKRACTERPERDGKAQFLVQDVMRTSFPDQYFDAIVCNRLFHHFYEPAMRRAALTELRRISSGPVVVFYFDRFSLDALRLATLRFVFRRFRHDRIPISAKAFAMEAQSAGFRLDRVIWKRWGISPQAYAVFHPSTSAVSNSRDSVHARHGLSYQVSARPIELSSRITAVSRFILT
jgi:SAM-dependent methyltransferase